MNFYSRFNYGDEEPKDEEPQALVLSSDSKIVEPSTQEITVYGTSCQMFWKDVQYLLAVYIVKKGNVMGGESVTADHVFGRCLGERSDGKAFFSSVILPWITPTDYDWKPEARERLETFLDPECRCDARTEETKVCEYHEHLMWNWDSEDRQRMEGTRREALGKPPAKEGAGVYPLGTQMHRDYPWCVETVDSMGLRSFQCTICGFGKDPREAASNPTYRNVFIRNHSHCGFGDPKKYAPPESYVIEQSDKQKQRSDSSMIGQIITQATESFVRNHIDPEFRENYRKSVMNTKLTPEFLFSGSPQRKLGQWFNPPTGVCSACQREMYQDGEGQWWHSTRFRACDVSGRTVAQA